MKSRGKFLPLRLHIRVESAGELEAPMATALKAACIADGCILRIEGRGTMKESLVARELTARTLTAADNARMIFDLCDCEYLDSTFLGGLVELRNRFPNRFAIAAPVATRKKLLGPLRLDRIIPCIDSAPGAAGAWVDVKVPAEDKTELLTHVMHSHRLLSEFDTPMKSTFARIADQMAGELGRI